MWGEPSSRQITSLNDVDSLPTVLPRRRLIEPNCVHKCTVARTITIVI